MNGRAPSSTPEPEPAADPRPRFFGRRCGRPLRPGRRSLLLDRLPDVAVALPPGDLPIDPRRLFARPVSAVWLEIGFGAGEHLAGRAAAHPDVGLLGCEPFVNGVAALLAEVERLRLDNVRVFADDARPLLDRLAPASLDRVFLLFPDPWPKRRHHERRFVQAASVERLATLLAPGGELLFATDDADYARWTLLRLTDHPAFAWTARRAADFRAPPTGWITTRYQRKAEERGAVCTFLHFRRRVGA